MARAGHVYIISGDMLMKAQCKNCLYWNIDDAWGERKDKASCRVQPPRIRVGGLACDETAVWPSTLATHWCGEFAHRERDDDFPY